jgi:hypothetical protein
VPAQGIRFSLKIGMYQFRKSGYDAYLAAVRKCIAHRLLLRSQLFYAIQNYGISGNCSIFIDYLIDLLRKPKISQGWRNFLARIPINSATDPIEKIKQKKRSPLSLQKDVKLSLANFKSLLKVVYI